MCTGYSRAMGGKTSGELDNRLVGDLYIYGLSPLPRSKNKRTVIPALTGAAILLDNAHFRFLGECSQDGSR